MIAVHVASRARMRSAFALIGLALIACAPVRSAEPSVASFACEGGRSFNVTQTGKGVTVQVGERRYALTPKRSSIGERYVSPHASLIIDGTFAAFVADDLFDLEGCHSVQAPA